MWDVILPFWVIMRSGRWNVMNHIASRGVIFGRSFFGARGFFLPWVILRRERHHDHIWIFCDVSSGWWRRVLIWHMGGVYPYMGPSIPPQVFRGTKADHSLLLISVLNLNLSDIPNYYILSSNKGIFVWPIWPEVNCPYFHTPGK